MNKYYIQITETGTLYGFSECLVTGDNIAENIEVLYEIFKMIEASKDKYMYDFKTSEWVERPNYEEEQLKKEKERIAKLSLTAADVERAIYKIKGMDFEDILNLVKNTPSIDSKALKIEFKANNFYRGNPYISQVGQLLGFSETQLDKFFESGNPEDLEYSDD